MDWGVLQGLGQGLQSIGKWKMEQDAEKRRTMMAEQLQRDREERAKLAYDSSQDSMEKSPEGVWFTVKKNKGGEVMDRVLAPKNKIEEAEDAEKTRGLKARLLEAQVSNTEYSGKRALIEDTREDEDRNLLSPEDRRQVARYKGGLDITPAQQLQANTSLQTAAAARKAPAGEQTLSEWATDTINNTPDLHKFVDNGDLTQDQLNNAVAMAGASYARSGIGKPSLSNLRGYIQQMIDEGYYKNPHKKTGATPPSLELPTKK